MKVIKVSINSEVVYVANVNYTTLSQEEVGEVSYTEDWGRALEFTDTEVDSVITKISAFSEEFSGGLPTSTPPKPF